MTDELTPEELASGVVMNEGRLTIKASLKMDTAAAVLAAAERHVRAADCVIDLSDVPAVDSAALTVVLGLVRIARETGHRFSIANAPAAFDSLAALYGVDELLSQYLILPPHTAHA